MKRTHVLFSFSAMALTFSAFASVLLLDKPTNGDNRKETPIVESKVAPVLPDPLPLVIELPDPPKAVKVELPKPKAVKAKLVMAAALPKEKQMVCEDVWNDSNIGGKYKRCEMK